MSRLYCFNHFAAFKELLVVFNCTRWSISLNVLSRGEQSGGKSASVRHASISIIKRLHNLLFEPKEKLL